MKKFALLMAALFVMFGLAGCGETEVKNPDVADVMAQIKSEIAFPEMADHGADELQYYGYDTLNADQIDSAAYTIASSGLTAEEVLIIKLKDAKDADAVKAMMETRRDQIAATAMDYTPEEMNKINTAVIGAKGQYVYFAITGDNEKAKEIFNESF